jgi:hypothetical protein
MYKYFKAKEKLKKIFNYFSIFTIIFGTTFGSIKSAYAEDLAANSVWGSAIVEGAGTIADPSASLAVDLASYKLTIGNAGSAVAVGAITATSGTTTNIVAVLQDASGAAMTVTIASIAGDTDDLTITSDANGTGAVATTVTGTTVLADDLVITAAGDFETSLTATGALTAGGVTTLTATGADAVLNINAAGTNDIGTGVLDDDTGIAKIVIGGSADQTFSGATAGAGAGEGTIQNSNTVGTVTVSDILGGTNELEALTLDASSTTIFSAAVDAVTITSAGTASYNAGLVKATTLNQTAGTITIDADDAGITLANLAGTGPADVNLSNNTTLNFTIATGEATQVDATIDGTTDGYGDLNFYNTTANAPGVITLNDDIGATKELNSITIGSSTVAGSVATVDGATIDIGSSTLNVKGGDADAEDSLLAIKDNLTARVLLTQSAGSATLTTSDDATITGTIDAAGSGGGSSILNVTGSSKTATFAGNIGSSTALDTITIDTASAVFKNNVTATTMSLADAAGDATFSGTVAQTFTGNITATDGEGTLKNSNTTAALTVTGTVGAENARLLEVEIDDDTNTILQSSIYAITLDINSDLAAEFVQVSEGNIIGTDGLTAGALQIASGAVIHLDEDVVDGTTVFDVTEVTGSQAGVLIAGDFTIRPSSSFYTGTVKFIDGVNADLLDSTGNSAVNTELANILVTDNALTDFTVAAGATAGADVNITASAKSDATTSSELSTTINDAKSLRAANIAVKTARASDSTAETSFNDAINAFGSFGATEDTALAKQVGPQNDMISGSTVATRAVTGTVQGIMSSRMASLRSGDAYFGTGMSAGAMMSANSGFIQAFGTEAEQKNKTVGSGTQYGYDSQSSGVAIGFDGINDNGAVVGLSLSMSSTDVDGKGTGKAKNDIDSYTASIYMDKATDSGYIEGSLTVGLNENNSSRLVNTAGLSRTYKGSYDSQQVSLKIGGGVPNSVGNNGYVTPFGSITGTIIETDAYTETSTTSSDSLRLRVAQDDVSSVVGTVGVKYHNVMSNGGVPMISLAINNEFGDDTINSTNTYQGGGTSFTTSTAVEELSATLGLGYSMGNDVSSVEFAYEANVNDDDYLGHYGSFKIVTKF